MLSAILEIHGSLILLTSKCTDIVGRAFASIQRFAMILQSQENEYRDSACAKLARRSADEVTSSRQQSGSEC